MAADDFNMGLSTTSDPTYINLCEHYGVSDPGHLPAKIHELDPSFDAITASNKRKLLISDSAAVILRVVTSQSEGGSKFPTSASDAKTLAWRVVWHCVDTLAKDIQDVVERVQSLAGPGFRADQMALAMTGGIIARPVIKNMLVWGLTRRGIRFKDSTVIENAADHGATSLSKAFGRGT
ncbi:hypothetical protein QFC22_004611 [Naganishia vaughanmartiniae]|uniref:Uncharacterized protein n=1 Tax=Naganishia vaughanmartiniae TaxID=1424756 RepID=A0ACC2WZL1_9TREE|nr:hypothetical protein QFC22_004611 [Naganishia vaughanmartiniae]